jgi:mycothione reductase
MSWAAGGHGHPTADQAMSFGLGARAMATGQYWIHPGLPEVVENALQGLDV